MALHGRLCQFCSHSSISDNTLWVSLYHPPRHGVWPVQRHRQGLGICPLSAGNASSEFGLVDTNKASQKTVMPPQFST
jgi:hypothetical protein